MYSPWPWSIGIPAVADYIASVVRDIATRYDVDGIHFDDYFYSYGGTPNQLDQDAYELYALPNESRADFRRRSVNTMVEKSFLAVKAVDPKIRFGVSPFGIWSTDQQVVGLFFL